MKTVGWLAIAYASAFVSNFIGPGLSSALVVGGAVALTHGCRRVLSGSS